MTKNVEIHYFIQTEMEDNDGDVGGKEMENVDMTGTCILKPNSNNWPGICRS